MNKHMHGLLLLAVMMLSIASSLSATEVTFRLVDQFGGPIEGSRFVIGPDTYPPDSAITLVPGAYPVDILPGLNDTVRTPFTLFRKDTVTVSGASQTIILEWRRGWLKHTLEDQFGASIPASRFFVQESEIDLIFPSGDSVFIPVTEDPTHNDPLGISASGYQAISLPGILDSLNIFRLLRRESREELTVSGLTRTYVWPIATITVEVRDQFGAPYDSCLVDIFNLATLWRTPATLSFPVTEDATNPLLIEGFFADGLEIRVFPGFNGLVQWQTLRFEPKEELTVAGFSKIFEWKRAYLKVTVRDQFGDTIPASQYDFVGNFVGTQEFLNGDSVLLPVTEDADHLPVIGVQQDGYLPRPFPGVTGILQGHLLHRFEARLELTATGLSRTFIWKTAYFKVTIKDQFGQPITNSQFDLALDFLPNGDSLLLPVTSDPFSPQTVGLFSDGYLVRLFPAINGIQNPTHVWYNDSSWVLTDAGRAQDFVWPITQGVVMLVDNLENTISDAKISIFPYVVDSLSCAPLRLPITDGPLFEQTLTSSWVANGYPFLIEPFPGAGFTLVDSLEIAEDFSVTPSLFDIGGTMYGIRIDPDSDCVSTAIDNCDFTFNPSQLNSDADSLGDACDNCVFGSNNNQGDYDSLGTAGVDGLGDACFMPSYTFPLSFVAKFSPPPGALGRSMVGSGINLTIIDPDGLSIGADDMGVITNTIDPLGINATYDQISGDDSITINIPKTGIYTLKATLEFGGIPGCCAIIGLKQGGEPADSIGPFDKPSAGIDSTIAVIEQTPFAYGDADGDRKINIADVTYMIARIFSGGPGPQPVEEAGDANCDGGFNIADVTFLINYIFSGGAGPPCLDR